MIVSDGDATDRIRAFPGTITTVIPARGYAVVLDPEFAGDYPLPAEAVRLAPENTSLGNSLATNDPITLLAGDGLTVVSTFSIPFNPGNGVSAERRGDVPDVAGNWVASTCASRSSPGAKNCADPS